MSENDNRPTDRKLERLRDDILEELEAGPRRHLDEEVFVEYSMNTLTADQLSAANLHISSCKMCSLRLEQLKATAAAWEGAAGERRLQSLSDRFLEEAQSRWPAARDLQAASAKAPAQTWYRLPRWMRAVGIAGVWHSRPVAVVAVAALLVMFVLTAYLNVVRSTASLDDSISTLHTDGAPDVASGDDSLPGASKGGLASRSSALAQDERAAARGATSPMAGAGALGGSQTRSASPRGGSVASVPPIAGANPSFPSPLSSPAVSPRTGDVASSRRPTPYPPDLTDAEAAGRKRQVAVAPFNYSTVTPWVQYWFNSPYNIGDGVREMLTARMAQSETVRLLEREKVEGVTTEQGLAPSNRTGQPTGSMLEQVGGPDASLYGDIVIFGRDDTTRRRGTAGVGAVFGRAAGVAVAFNRAEKAVVAFVLRLVDNQTGQVIEAVEVRGESSRPSSDYAAGLGVAGAGRVAGGGSSAMTSADFQQTIIGEATANAVAQAVEYLEKRAVKIPARSRAIEGRVVLVTEGAATLAVGRNDGVLRGDRFEILQANTETRELTTEKVIGLDLVKVGELVVDNVQDRTSSGAYGGQALSPNAVATAGGRYLARLIPR